MPIIGVIASSAKGAPGTPTIGTATDVGTSRAYNNGAATVTFTPGSGGVATSFTATSSPGGFTATGASSPLTVTGLQSGVSYTFTVTGTNAAGTSAASAASNSITATTVPQAPTIGTATGGDTTASVAFTAGATGGKTVSTYTATSSPGSITGTNSASPITVTGLTNGTAYTFTVTATNANGTSTASAASNSVTPAVASSFYNIASTLNPGAADVTFSGLDGYSYATYMIRGVVQSSFTGYTDLMFRVNGTGNTTYYNYIQGKATDDFGGQTSTSGTTVNLGSVLSGSSQDGWTVFYMVIHRGSGFHNVSFRGASVRNSGASSDTVFNCDAEVQTTGNLSSITITNSGGYSYATGSQISIYGVE
jgi:hypothetical protein